MKLRTVAKVGTFLSVILFCAGVIFYGFTRMYDAEEGKEVNLLSLVPADCIGVLETDNLDFLSTAIPMTAYADKFDSVYTTGILPLVFKDLLPYAYAGENTHGVGNYMGRLMVSFHSANDRKAMVAYFSTSLSGTKLFGELLKKKGIDFRPKKEKHRGKDIVIFPVKNGEFLATYSGHGFVTVSYQKSLIEKVIDAEKDGSLQKKDPLFSKTYRNKEANFVTLYARSASFPLLSNGHRHGWSEFDIHLNSEVFYLSGAMHVPDTCAAAITDKLTQIQPVTRDSALVLPKTEKIDSCINVKAELDSRSIFDECVMNLSGDAIYAMVVDMDEVARNPEPYRDYLPVFVYDHPALFRSFVFSLQMTKSEDSFSHLLVFTYKD